MNREIESSYHYLDFAEYFKALGLEGYGNCYEILAKEEIDHALLIYEFLQDNNIRPVVAVVTVENKKSNDVRAILEYCLKSERRMTRNIDDVYQLACELNDDRSIEFLSALIAEQFKEEIKAKKMLDEYDLMKCECALFTLDSTYQKNEYIERRLINENLQM